MKKIKSDAPEIIWSGAVSLEKGDGWVKPWRLDFKNIELFHEGVQGKAENPAGVRLRFATDSQNISLFIETLRFTYAAPPEDAFDIYIDGDLLYSRKFPASSSELKFDELPAGMKTVEIWLSQNCVFKLEEIGIDEGCTIERSEDNRPKWITYGSSISQCALAASPSFTWPGVVARGKDLNLTCLGYGGQCHIDSMVARMIRDLPVDLITLKLGINVNGQGSLNMRSFKQAAIGSVAIIREKHIDTPIVICSPAWSPPRESTPNRVDMTLEIMRDELKAMVDVFKSKGDENIYYIDGLKLCGPELKEFLPDELHPDAEGYKRLGENFIRELDKLDLKL